MISETRSNGKPIANFDKKKIDSFMSDKKMSVLKKNRKKRNKKKHEYVDKETGELFYL